MFTCSSCLWLVKNRTHLCCGHIFCETCISTKIGEIFCPLHKEITSVKESPDEEEMDIDVINVDVSEEEMNEVLRDGFQENGINHAVNKFEEAVYSITSNLNGISSSLAQIGDYEGSSTTTSKEIDDNSTDDEFIDDEFLDTKSESSFNSRDSYVMNRFLNTEQKTDRKVEQHDGISFKNCFSCVLRLENFSVLKNDARNGFDEILFSKPFSHEGYLMCILVCPNGIGEARSEYLSFYFQIIEGEIDEILNWPCRFHARYCLLSEVDDVGDYRYKLPQEKSIIHSPTQKGMTYCRGTKFFFPLDKLKSNYLVNDCITLKLEIVFI